MGFNLREFFYFGKHYIPTPEESAYHAAIVEEESKSRTTTELIASIDSSIRGMKQGKEAK